MENTKICSKCGRELPLSEFNKDKTRKDGLQFWCKSCKKQYRKQYYTANRELELEQQKQWRADNPDYMKQYYAEYYSTLEGYAYNVRWNNLRNDIKYGRIAADELPSNYPTNEDYMELLQMPDFYDGKQYHWSEMGLDRIDNSKPHTLDNIVPCRTANNVRRQKMSFEEFCEVMKN